MNTDRTQIKLGDKDTALIFRADGRLEMFLTNKSEAEQDTPVENCELLTMAVSMHLSDPQFVQQMIKSATDRFQHIQDESGLFEDDEDTEQNE